MRRTLYGLLLRTPIKVTSGAATAIGAIGTLWPARAQSKIGESMTPDQIELISKGLLIAGVVYFALLWLLKPGEGGAPPIPVHQTTQGPQSPIFRDIHGDVHIGGAPAATQERKTGHWRLPLAVGHGRAFEADQWRDSHEFFAHDMPLWSVVHRVQRTLASPSDEHEGGLAEYEHKIDQIIADAAYNRRMHTWGRQGDGRLKPLPRIAWELGKLDHQQGILAYRHPDNLRSRIVYRDIMFNAGEVDSWRPLPPDPGAMIA